MCGDQGLDVPFFPTLYFSSHLLFKEIIAGCRALGQCDLLRSLPTSAILWFCHIRGIYISLSTRKKKILCYDWKLFANSFFEVTFGTCKPGENLGHFTCVGSTITVKEKIQTSSLLLSLRDILYCNLKKKFFQQETQ